MIPNTWKLRDNNKGFRKYVHNSYDKDVVISNRKDPYRSNSPKTKTWNVDYNVGKDNHPCKTKTVKCKSYQNAIKTAKKFMKK